MDFCDYIFFKILLGIILLSLNYFFKYPYDRKQIKYLKRIKEYNISSTIKMKHLNQKLLERIENLEKKNLETHKMLDSFINKLNRE